MKRMTRIGDVAGSRLVARLALVACAIAAGCGEGFGGAGVPLPERDTVPMLQTSALSYELEEDRHGLRATIPFEFTNKGTRTIYFVHCAVRYPGQEERAPTLSMALEMRTDTGWTRVWSSFTPACLSPPIVIDPGDRYRDTLTLHGALPGGRAMPGFESEDLEGLHRLVWGGLQYDFDVETMRRGERLPRELTASNAFRLTR